MSEVARLQRSQRQSWAQPGSAHDKLVGTLKVALPSAVGVVAAMMVFLPLTAAGDVSFVLDKNKVEVANERLRLQAATYRGQDNKGQPFVLTAGSAVQKSSAEPIVEIDKIAARLQMSEGPATFNAPGGRYDLNQQKVGVSGPIVFTGPNGYRLETSAATVDMKTKTMESTGGVSGRVPQGTFSADRMSADLDNQSVRLSGRARLRIVPGRAR